LIHVTIGISPILLYKQEKLQSDEVKYVPPDENELLMKIQFPILMLGPFLRPFLIVCIIFPGGLAVVFFTLSRWSRFRSPCNSDLLANSAISMGIISVFFALLFVCLWFLGMP
jgi:hypothetical protein